MFEASLSDNAEVSNQFGKLIRFPIVLIERTNPLDLLDSRAQVIINANFEYRNIWELNYAQ